MTTQDQNKAAEERLQSVSAALELAAEDLSKLVEKMRKVLEQNRASNSIKGQKGDRGEPGPAGPPGKDAT